MTYPFQIIRSYADGEIDCQQFIGQFSGWQKSQGINYDCKGTADRNGTYLTYRGVTAVFHYGALRFTADGFQQSAETLFEFRRKVDFALCRKLRGAEWS